MQTVTSACGGAEREYAEILRFVNDHNHITYKQFDSYTLQDVHLFDVPKDDYFKMIEELLDQIIRALPAMKRIFAKPIVRLKDTHEIVPVEMAHIINSHTISHASLHSEMWDDVSEEGIKPKKLMTVGRTETYAVYENIVFTHVVDAIFRMLRRTEDILKDVLYNCRDMHFNLLDRTHHAHFFLALGKLYMEYASAQEFQYASYFRCVEKIYFIERTLRAKLRSPVYVQCKKKSSKITLKKTNAFRVHKDYKEVYRIAKWVESDLNLQEVEPGTDEILLQEEYRAFCILLSVFSAGHFNFTFPKEQTFDFLHFQTTCAFRDWKLTMRTFKSHGLHAMLFRFQKDVTYTVCMIFGEKKKIPTTFLKKFQLAVEADEYLFANPKEYGERDVLYLSLFNIDSFRRLQQVLLRGMICSDTKRKECPFCGHVLEQKNDTYECHICSAQIFTKTCEETNEPYFVSAIKEYQLSAGLSKQKVEHRRFLHDRYVEASLHFRNITPITSDGTPICPKCGKVHR